VIRLILAPDTIGPVSRGHPWVYASGVTERAPVGEPVQLMDGRGKAVAFGLADDGDIAVRVLGRHAMPIPRLIAERLASATALRRQVLPPDTSAHRLINGAGDGLPGVVIDRYGSVLVLRLYSKAWVPWLDPLVAAISSLEGVATVLRRYGVRNVDGRSGIELLHGPTAPEPLIVTEAGLRFLVRPGTGQKTGLFLDQREHRMRVASLANGLDLVNLFGYTGGFSVHAAAAGARRITTVDIAPDALEDAKDNFRLNGLDPDAHAFVCTDAFQWEPEAPMPLVVSDPPSLSHGKKADARARIAYRDLATRTGRMVAPGGILATASCTARLSGQAWEEAIRTGVRKAGRWAWLWRANEPPDHPVALGHPEGRYLKFALLHKRS